MKFNSKVHHRKSIRLKGYDYSLSGSYFVTIGTQNQKCLFGEIIGGKMVLNNAGCEAEKCWNLIPAHFSHVKLDEYIVMPNHVHGILTIINSVSADTNGTMNTVVGAKNFRPSRHGHPAEHRKPSGRLFADSKSASQNGCDKTA